MDGWIVMRACFSYTRLKDWRGLTRASWFDLSDYVKKSFEANIILVLHVASWQIKTTKICPLVNYTATEST